MSTVLRHSLHLHRIINSAIRVRHRGGRINRVSFGHENTCEVYVYKSLPL